MPILAALIGSIASGIAGLLAQFMTLQLALKYASYLAWMAVLVAFLASIHVCLSTIDSAMRAMLGGSGGINGGLMSALAMGLGMLIPPNAGGILACVSSVWIATSLYKIQRRGIENYSK